MRIGYDLRPAQGPSRGRGIGRYTRGLLQALAREAGPDCEFVLVAWDGAPLPDLDAGMRRRIVAVPAAEARPLVRMAGVTGKGGPQMLLHRALDRRALARVARRERLDVMLFPALFEMTFFGADDLSCPVIKVCYDFGPYVWGGAFGMGRTYARVYQEEMERFARAAAVIAISDYTRADLLRLTATEPARAHRIYPGIESFFGPVPAGDTAAARARFCPDGDFFLASGGLDVNKNLEAAVDALGLLRANAAPGSPARAARLLVLGAPPDKWHPRRDPLIARAAARGLAEGRDLVFLPRVSDREMAALYAASVALVFPSRFEGFGLPPAECMACGAPAIVSDSTSLPEVVGDAGIVVGVDDASASADAMASLLGDPAHRQELIARGRERAAQFSWPAAAAQTWELLAGLGGQHTVAHAAAPGRPALVDMGEGGA